MKSIIIFRGFRQLDIDARFVLRSGVVKAGFAGVEHPVKT